MYDYLFKNTIYYIGAISDPCVSTLPSVNQKELANVN